MSKNPPQDSARHDEDEDIAPPRADDADAEPAEAREAAENHATESEEEIAELTLRTGSFDLKVWRYRPGRASLPPIDIDTGLLRHLAGDVAAMSQIRRLMIRATGRPLSAWTDARVLDWFETQLSTRRLQLTQSRMRGGAGVKRQQNDPTRGSTGPRPFNIEQELANAPVAEASAPPPAPRPVLRKSPVDVGAQVTALLAAAQQGTPFCEQCERARREAEAAERV